MSAKHWALSVFFVWHLTAITLGSLASPGPVAPVGPTRYPHNNPIAAVVTPALDKVAAAVAPLPNAILHAFGPVRVLAATYIEASGVHQSWKMFSIPPQVHQYMRVRYYIGTATDNHPKWVATELVLPAHREDQVRFIRSYWNGFRDKAVTIALTRFYGNRKDSLIRPDTKSSELPDDLAPVGRYFARKFQQRVLKPDERVVRTEIWYGVAPMPGPGESLDPERREARMSILRDYYQGPVEDQFAGSVYPEYHSVDDQGEIRWVLEYYEP